MGASISTEIVIPLLLADISFVYTTLLICSLSKFDRFAISYSSL